MGLRDVMSLQTLLLAIKEMAHFTGKPLSSGENV